MVFHHLVSLSLPRGSLWRMLSYTFSPDTQIARLTRHLRPSAWRPRLRMAGLGSREIVPLGLPRLLLLGSSALASVYAQAGRLQWLTGLMVMARRMLCAIRSGARRLVHKVGTTRWSESLGMRPAFSPRLRPSYGVASVAGCRRFLISHMLAQAWPLPQRWIRCLGLCESRTPPHHGGTWTQTPMASSPGAKPCATLAKPCIGRMLRVATGSGSR